MKNFLLVFALSVLAHGQMMQTIVSAKPLSQDTGITFSPPAGAVSNPTTVTFSGAIAGSIYCSTQDGSTPKTNGIGTACVTGSLGNTTSITSAVTVKAVSGLLGELDSPVASAAYTISGGADPAITQSISCFSSFSATSTTCAYTSSVTAGQELIVFSEWGSNTNTLTGVTDNCNTGGTSNSYTLGTAAPDAGSVTSIRIAYATVGATTTTCTVTITISAASGRIYNVMTVVSNPNGIDGTLSAISGVGAGTNNISSGAITTTVNNDLVIGIFMNNSQNADTPTAGTSPSYTTIYNTATNGVGLLVEDLTQGTAGSIAGVASAPAFATYGATVIAVKHL